MKKPMIFSIGILLDFGLYYVFYYKVEYICDMTDGKWSSVKYQCIRPNCVKDNSCGEWSSPSMYCPKIKVGMQKDMVYFWLGEPLPNSTSNQLIWSASKVESGIIAATFENDKLTQFSCPKE